MSPSQRLNRLINDAWLNDDIHSAIHSYNEYLISHCSQPFRQRIIDAHTQTERIITIPCGRCYHCVESKINEWCTRMYAHAEDFKHVYFVTLTYRSFVSIDSDVSELVLAKLNDAIWHYDSLNMTHHKSWNPCLLVKSHYQNFIKRLRKNTGLKDITYVLSGEYGSRFGRPHFHLVLFTNGVLTKADIVRAWSVCLWRDIYGSWSYRRNQKHNGNAYDFPIGRVDFNDLVSNGTFNTTAKIRIDGTYMNAANCFAYVCKYVCKRDSANLKRVSLAYDSIFERGWITKHYDNAYAFQQALDYIQNARYPYEQKTLSLVNELYELSYEKNLFKPRQDVFARNLSNYRKQNLYGHSVVIEFYPQFKQDFCDSFRPFCEFSRGVPIGSVYAKRNLQEFKEGVYSKPILQDSGFVVPSYFRRKASESSFGLRRRNKSIKGVSYGLGGLVNLDRLFQEYLENPLSHNFHSLDSAHCEDINSALQTNVNVFRDLSSGEFFLIGKGLVRGFKYSRSSKSYYSSSTVPLVDWIRFWSLQLKSEFDLHNSKVQFSFDSEKNRDAALCKLVDLGIDPALQSQLFSFSSALNRDHLQLLYDDVHKSVD